MIERMIYKKNSYHINPDKIIVCSIVWFYFFNFVFIGKFPINIIPILIGVPGYLVFVMTKRVRMSSRLIISWVALVIFCLLALIYLVLEAGIGAIFSIEFFFFLSLPLLYLATFRLIRHGFLELLVKWFLIFLAWQLFVVLGQALKRFTGFGFNLPSYYSDGLSDSYDVMLTGTFLNANDLAAVSGMLFVFFLLVRPYFPKAATTGIFFCLILAVLTISRSVLFFMVFSLAFFLVARAPLRGSLWSFVIGAVLVSSFYFAQVYFIQIDFISRIVMRAETLWLVLNYGFSADHSISLRIASYVHFLANLDNLGLGSMKIRDYGMFFDSLGPGYELMAVNPHSFFVEVGYWLGWLGLVLFLLFIFLVKPRKFLGYLYVIFSFFVLSLVSSSIINNFIFFLVFFSSLGVSTLLAKFDR